jgi:hypothetical protein
MNGGTLARVCFIFICIILPLSIGLMAYSWRPGFPSRVFFDTNQRPAGLSQVPGGHGRIGLGLKRHGSEPHGLDIARIAATEGAEMSWVQFA